MRLDTPLTCPDCKMSFTDAKSVNPIVTKPAYGDVVLCGFCGKPSIVTLLGTELMTDDQMNALHPDDMADLLFAQRAIQKKVRQS